MTTLGDLLVCANRHNPDEAVVTIVSLVELGDIAIVDPEEVEDPQVILTDKGLLASILGRHV